MWAAGRKLFTSQASPAPPPVPLQTPKTDRGVATLSQAVEQGRRHTVGQPGASAQVHLYEEGVELVLEGIRSESNSEARKAELRELVASCLTRAEALKQSQRSASAVRGAASPGGRGDSAVGGRGAAGGLSHDIVNIFVPLPAAHLNCAPMLISHPQNISPKTLSETCFNMILNHRAWGPTIQ